MCAGRLLPVSSQNRAGEGEASSLVSSYKSTTPLMKSSLMASYKPNPLSEVLCPNTIQYDGTSQIHRRHMHLRRTYAFNGLFQFFNFCFIFLNTLLQTVPTHAPLSRRTLLHPHPRPPASITSEVQDETSSVLRPQLLDQSEAGSRSPQWVSNKGTNT